MEETQKIWESVLAIIKPDMTSTSYDHWFSTASIRSIDEITKIVYLEEPKEFTCRILNNRYMQVLEQSFKQVLQEDYRIIVKQPSDYKTEPKPDLAVTQKKIEKVNSEFRNQRIFNPTYSFDDFIVGECNEIAYAVSKAVAENPSKSYNPLFLHGGSGLGKTHLMHAIGIYLLEHNTDINVLYVTSEMFTNELIKALGEKNGMREFKKKFRQVDVLMIDDIEFLEGKKTMQIEFFNTFEELYAGNKQIIISSDRAPEKLTDLDERLRSRFMWKMVAELQPADYETRVAILQKKAKNAGFDMSDELYDVIQLIAERVHDNIRVLEGSLNRVIEISSLLNEPINRQFAKRVLKDLVMTGNNNPTPVQIKTVVSKHFHIKVADIESSKRTNQIAYPRQIAMYLCRSLTDASFPQIGQYFGGKHYTTVMHACEKIQKEIVKDETLKSLIEDLKKEIKDVN